MLSTKLDQGAPSMDKRAYDALQLATMTAKPLEASEQALAACDGDVLRAEWVLIAE